MNTEDPTFNVQRPPSNEEIAELECPFTLEWGLVTPDRAAQWLAEAGENRKLKQDTIDTYTRDMLTGRWFPTHQGIAFRPDGKLFEGQHRLSAIVKSGRAQWMAVFRYKTLKIEGVKATAIEVFDRGVTRSVADVLGLEHGMKEEANAVAAALLHIARICVKFPRFQARKASASQSIGVLELFRPQMEWLINVRCSRIGLRRIELLGTMAFAHAALPQKAHEFYEAVITGNGSHGAPARLLHGALVEDVVGLADWSLRSSAEERKKSAGIVLALFRAHIAGEKREKLPTAEEGAAAMAHFHEHLRDKVLACAALFPMVREEEKPKRADVITKQQPKEPEAARATRTFVQAQPSAVSASAAAPVAAAETPVTRASDLRMTPAAAKLLAAAGGHR